MDVLNIIDWIAIIFFGGATVLIGIAALFFFAVVACNNSHDSFY